MTLTDFRTLGRSGLIVSSLALGTMTFGTPGWGTSDHVSQDIFQTYVDAGGNFIDTADVYAGGQSEEMLGHFIADSGLRDHVVLATKFSFHGGTPGNVNAGGNGRKHLYRALEGSLRRLRTDYIDLYWMHVWDTVTPIEEVLESLSALVRAGKIRYFGFSNLPAWYVAKAATLATAHAIPSPIALQLCYSLLERNIEREHVPAARACGLGICAWSPLAAGFLTGKYQQASTGISDVGRLSGDSPFGDRMFTEHNWRILDTLRTVAAQMEQPLTRVALAWAAAQPGMTSLIVGASTREQVQENLASLAIHFSPEQLQTLNEASAPDDVYPYSIFTPQNNRGIFGGASVQGWS